MGALASYKAVLELLRKPFYWDKTSHGHFDATAPAAPLPRATAQILRMPRD